MINSVSAFIFTATGAFVIWLAKGLKGSLSNEMISVDERGSTKGRIRFYLGLGVWIALLVLASVILTRPTIDKAYKARMNEKGEIELEEIK